MSSLAAILHALIYPSNNFLFIHTFQLPQPTPPCFCYIHNSTQCDAEIPFPHFSGS